MNVVVAIETATVCCSVAVADEEGRLLAEVVAPTGPAHTRRLLPDLHHALGMAQVERSAIGTVLVGIGPGTFTGLRIGVATARALAQSSSARLVGVPSLAALGLALAEGDAAVKASAYVALIDGRRQEVFAACYAPSAGCRTHDAHQDAETCSPLTVVRDLEVVPVGRLQAYLAAWPSAVVGGDGAHLYPDELPVSAHLARGVRAPTASMVLRAWQRGVPGIVEGLGATVPLYGRPPDAARWNARGASR